MLEFLPRPALAFGLIDPSFFGTYHGIFIPLAARGGSLGEAALSLRVDAQGLVLGARLPGDEREWTINYTREWVRAGRPGDPCLSIRQSLEAEDYAYQLCFQRAAAGRGGVRMRSNHGRSWGEFTRVGAGETKAAVNQRVNAIFQRHFVPARLRGINRMPTLMDQGAGATREKIEVLTELRADFQDFNHEQRARYEPLIIRAFHDAEPAVRLAALRVFARLPTASSVAALIELARRHDLTPEVAEQTTRTLGLYLETVNEVLERRRRTALRFGADDVDTVHRRSLGATAARDMNTLDLMIFTPRLREWTVDHQRALRHSLIELATEGPDFTIRQIANDWLRMDQTLDQGCGAKLAGLGRRG